VVGAGAMEQEGGYLGVRGWVIIHKGPIKTEATSGAEEAPGTKLFWDQ
jgi:hypothetical protein